MQDFVLKEFAGNDIQRELKSIGYDSSYVSRACEKFRYKNIKIFDVTAAQANIIKQTALSVGADCATHREAVTGKAEKSDCMLAGSISQLGKIAAKLSAQPFGLKELGKLLDEFIRTGDRHAVKIVGILNLTTNSFSDGGLYYDTDKAIEHLKQMAADGADMIDIGAESTKPYSDAVSDREQLKKLRPVLEYAKKELIIPVSIDTRSSKTAEECLKMGADIINDVSGFDYDEKMPEVIAKYGAKVIIQHSKGTPLDMQNNPEYSNLMDEIYLSLHKKIDLAVSKGIERANITIDPGIGFGKTRRDNFEIIRRVEELYGLNCPVMLGISRKSLLNMPDADNSVKDIYTLALNSVVIAKKADFIRVHNVKLHKGLLEMLNT